MLSQCYGDAHAQAVARAAHARSARAAAQAAAAAAAAAPPAPDPAGAGNATNSGCGVSEPTVQDTAGSKEDLLAESLPGVAAQARKGKYAGEEELRSQSVLSFLQRDYRLRRMLLYRQFMDFMSEARVQVL